jgi:hypothetical protein
MRLATAAMRVRDRTERETARAGRIGGGRRRFSLPPASAPDPDSDRSVPGIARPGGWIGGRDADATDRANLAIMQRTRRMLMRIIKLLETP